MVDLNKPPAEIHLTRHVWETMLQAVDALAPEEACGLVGGRNGSSTRVIPIENQLHSPVRYVMAPEKTITALISLDDGGEELLAIFHSHPSGPPYPSPTDVREANYPEAGHIIWFQSDAGWDCRGFIIQDGEYNEIPLNIVE